ncbi:peptidase [Candidatus Woesebacteria bacterium RBG_13_34_9]|uniref:Peptidase n=1 Tax=Candidatus Woesebacteria bacterium RBG_13_34_9 TaxID=1802477 RepID=A0A1F7X1B9_9BACT|nr:MAG: peptidase [Candidatus Woesebacteria bacterium RBG_13_34_9]
MLNQINFGGLINEPSPLSIEYMRKQEYPGSDVVIEQTLPSGSNYNRYIASYKSDGLKINALLTVPQGENPPAGGWPVIIFNHGYIQPEEYRTTEKYIAYTDAFSRNGYIVFKSDYRGHGNSGGKPEGAYYSPAYTIDILNAVSSMKKYKDADPERIGMWGHSMGGMITLRSMVVTNDIKAGEIWAGVVASYEDLTNNWHHPDLNPRPFIPSQREQAARRPGRKELIDKYGSFEENPRFWQSISPISFVKDVSGPVQLQHGTTDEQVPILFSQKLDEALRGVNKTVEFYSYKGDDHNLSNNLNLALQHSVDFFDKYLKN